MEGGHLKRKKQKWVETYHTTYMFVKNENLFLKG